VSTLHDLAAGKRTPIVCYVTDRHTLKLGSHKDVMAALTAKIQAIISAGVDWVQLREKDISARELASLTREAMLHSAAIVPRGARRARILVNDRLDVALAAEASGIHLGENSLRPDDVRRLLQSWLPIKAIALRFLVGVSCHSLKSAERAKQAGADYIFFGPIFSTPSKIEYGRPQGLAALKEVCHSVEVPVFAIGGITTENAASCVHAGAKGIAAIRLFQDSPDPARVAQELHSLGA
jgi:thiamine-phosphate pyrophosphorylase